MFPDLFELQDILASPIATTVFIYATSTMLLANAALALMLLNRSKETHPPVRILPRAI
jgi:hypothetical protein